MYLERDNDTDGLQKSVYIYTFVFTGTYTGPFCHNPVESRLIPLDSGSIPLESSRFLWNPVESGGMDAFLQESVGHQKVQGACCRLLVVVVRVHGIVVAIHGCSLLVGEGGGGSFVGGGVGAPRCL